MCSYEKAIDSSEESEKGAAETSSSGTEKKASSSEEAPSCSYSDYYLKETQAYPSTHAYTDGDEARPSVHTGTY